MKLLDVTEVRLERVDLNTMTQHQWTPYETIPGTVGVATIIRHIAVKIGKFTKDDATDEIGLRVLIGMGWEAMVMQLYPNVWWQPGVYVLNGIAGHPDAFGEVLVPEPEPCVDECKYTAKSIRVPGGKENQHKSILDEWIWNAQAMGYCKLDPREPVHGRFHVCWAMNNYTKFTLDEKYYRYLVRYERDEIERNWKMLEGHRDEVYRSII